MAIIILILLILCGGMSNAQQTEHVVIAVIDGARYTETFRDPAHQYIPFIWNNLRPSGTIYTSFYNDGVTQTNSGHSSILTGTWQSILNDGGEVPHQPTIFEYLRKVKNLPAAQTRVVLGKYKLDILSCSDHAEYGPSYGAMVDTTDFQYDDVYTLENIKDVISNSHPRLLIANLAGTDRAAHDGLWSGYIEKLSRADSSVNELWNFIQADPVYRDKTTLIVTNDHGRHTTNFTSHGDGCDGCRHLLALVMGPDTPAGRTDSSRHSQIDIAPTVGQMLGFPVSYSTGKLIQSAFSLPVAENYFFADGWNLISLPREPVNPAKAELFPTAVTPAIAYSGSYVSRETLQAGIGYWLKFDTAETVTITGFQNNLDTVEVAAGWNLIGSPGTPIPVASISASDPGIALGFFFRYSKDYLISDTLEPSFGYWVKSSQAGKIYLNPQPMLHPVSRSFGDELPPPPPGVTAEPSGPKTISLKQNYPNPFNPLTRIDYQIPTTGVVRLQLFDQLGKQVASLLDENRQAGAHSFEWNSGELPSGLYYCRLQTRGQVKTIKMILLK